MNENQQKTLSVVSLITGIVGLLIFGIILGIISLITGLLSWEEKLGKIGVVLGIIDILGVLILFS